MKIHSLSVKLTGMALLAGLLASPGTPPTAAGADAPGGEFDILARGPIHEAYAQPAQLDVKPSPIVPKQPPPPIEEVPPELKPEGSNVQWIGGYWAWDDEARNFVWVSGFWRDVPPGRQWVPGYWTRLADGWQWVPGYWTDPGRSESQYLPAPPANVDAGPSSLAPGDDYTWVSGCWVWRDRYLWRPGYWLRCYPGWVWTPSCYTWSPCGYLYVPGYWDYPLDCRGVLFAPALFHRPLWNVPGWFWQPRYCLYRPYLFNSLFVRPGCGFYFGDYYGARYAGLGYTPWINYRLGQGGLVDPLYGYQRWRNRDDPRWERDLAATYAARANGTQVLPRTLVQQTAQQGNAPQTPLLPLAKLDGTRLDNAVLRLQTVSETKLKQERDIARQVNALGPVRQKLESQLGNKLPDAPRTTKLELPKLPTMPTPATTTLRGGESKAPAAAPSVSRPPEGPLRSALPDNKPTLPAPAQKVESRPVEVRSPPSNAPPAVTPRSMTPSQPPAPVTRSPAPSTPAPAPAIRSASAPSAPVPSSPSAIRSAPAPAPSPPPAIRSAPAPSPPAIRSAPAPTPPPNRSPAPSSVRPGGRAAIQGTPAPLTWSAPVRSAVASPPGRAISAPSSPAMRLSPTVSHMSRPITRSVRSAMAMPTGRGGRGR
jgi:hypothetical protein